MTHTVTPRASIAAGEAFVNDYDLLFRGHGGWEQLPPWATFFTTLGAFLQRYPLSENRLVVGVALPSRAFAASLAAMGSVLAYLHNNLKSDLNNYFDELCALPHGTGVMMLRRDRYHELRQYPGVIVGVDHVRVNRNDESTGAAKLLKVQVSRSTMREKKAGGRVFLIDAQRANTIRILNGNETITLAELPATPSGSAVTRITDFAQSAVATASEHYIVKSKVSTLIIGSPGVLSREINEVKYGCCDLLGNLFEGVLGEVLKVRRFGGARKQFHSDIFAATSKWPPKHDRLAVPHVVVFDGALGFMKWRHEFAQSHLLILLDQTEALFLEATQRLNYEQSCSENNDLPPDFPVPGAGVELALFTEQTT